MFSGRFLFNSTTHLNIHFFYARHQFVVKFNFKRNISEEPATTQLGCFVVASNVNMSKQNQ